MSSNAKTEISALLRDMQSVLPPTTAETPTMTEERSEELLCRHIGHQAMRQRMRDACVRAEPGIDNMIDAILREMMEPSARMLFEGDVWDGLEHLSPGMPPSSVEIAESWRRMIQHILDETKD